MLKDKDYLIDIASKSIDYAKKNGATDVEVLVTSSITENLNIRNKKFDHSERSEVLSFGITTYIGKKKSNVSSSNLEKKNLQNLINRSIECTKISPEDKFCGLPDKKDLYQGKTDLDLYDETVLSLDKKKDILLTVENSAFQNSKIKNTNGSSFSEYKSNYVLANSNGLLQDSKTSLFSCFCEAVAYENGQMERDYESSVKRHYKDLMSANTIGSNAAEKATKRLGAKKIRSEILPVIFDKRISKSFLSLLASAISGSSFVRGVSFLQNYLDKKIFSDVITIIDDPLLPRELGSQTFDSEGVKSSEIILVENGYLKSLILDCYNSRALKTQTNGRSGGTTNFFMQKGKITIDEMIKNQKRAIIISEVIGRGGDITNGNYSVGASGYLIENGFITHPVNEITIAGNLLEMFKKIIPADDLEFKGSTNSPSILIEGLTIAGK